MPRGSGRRSRIGDTRRRWSARSTDRLFGVVSPSGTSWLRASWNAGTRTRWSPGGGPEYGEPDVLSQRPDTPGRRPAHIEICGTLLAKIDGRRVDPALPGRKEIGRAHV